MISKEEAIASLCNKAEELGCLIDEQAKTIAEWEAESERLGRYMTDLEAQLGKALRRAEDAEDELKTIKEEAAERFKEAADLIRAGVSPMTPCGWCGWYACKCQD